MKCNAVQDLVVLYKEGAVCDETRDDIRSHLFNCPRCRRYYRDYERLCSDNPSLTSDHSEPPVHDFAMLAHRIRIHHWLRRISRIAVGISAVAATVVVCRLLFRSKD